MPRCFGEVWRILELLALSPPSIRIKTAQFVTLYAQNNKKRDIANASPALLNLSFLHINTKKQSPTGAASAQSLKC
jgi:hypothetical protein